MSKPLTIIILVAQVILVAAFYRNCSPVSTEPPIEFPLN